MSSYRHLILRSCSRALVFIQTRHFSKVETLTKTKRWLPVIGLEVHAQIASESKLFSGASTKYGAPTNSQVAFLDASLPGTLPVLNRRCVEAGVLTALALNCHINLESYFDRKHYFYADLPNGYQITQQRRPLATRGHMSYVAGGGARVAGIWQLQLEQDSGKSLHDDVQGTSLIDLNRAGVGLMEIVTAPDFQSADDAAMFVRELLLVLRLLGTCDGKMEEGSLRVDASVSLHHSGEPLGTRCEVKNLNSLRFIRKAIDYEIRRQEYILTEGGSIENETRSYNPNEDCTVPMRDKEKVHDYRFLPEPNLLPLRLHDNPTSTNPEVVNVHQLRERLPILPEARRQKLTDLGLGIQHAVKLVEADHLWSTLTELLSKSERDLKLVYNILMQEITTICVEQNTSLANSQMTIKQIGDLVDLVQKKEISRLTIQKLIEECLQDSELDVCRTVQERGWSQITDPDRIAELCDLVIRDNPEMVKKYLAKQKSRHFQPLVHRVIQNSEGLAHPATVQRVLLQRLTQSTPANS